MRRLLVLAVFLSTADPAAAQHAERFEGYADWLRDGEVIADGQRIRTDARTRFKGVPGLDAVFLGNEIKVEGVRQPDGTVLARTLEAKPNRLAAFERSVYRDAETLEHTGLGESMVFTADTAGARTDIARVSREGPAPDRLRRTLWRLLPPWLTKSE
jgi:hypothetical protein